MASCTQFISVEAKTGVVHLRNQTVRIVRRIRNCVRLRSDPPDESIRISDCCESEHRIGVMQWVCPAISTIVLWQVSESMHTHSEEYVYVTADMSGAELRIIAEGADDPLDRSIQSRRGCSLCRYRVLRPESGRNCCCHRLQN